MNRDKQTVELHVTQVCLTCVCARMCMRVPFTYMQWDVDSWRKQWAKLCLFKGRLIVTASCFTNRRCCCYIKPTTHLYMWCWRPHLSRDKFSHLPSSQVQYLDHVKTMDLGSFHPDNMPIHSISAAAHTLWRRLSTDWFAFFIKNIWFLNIMVHYYYFYAWLESAQVDLIYASPRITCSEVFTQDMIQSDSTGMSLLINTNVYTDVQWLVSHSHLTFIIKCP